MARSSFNRIMPFVSLLVLLMHGVYASDGDVDPIYKACVEQCEKTGCVGGKCFQQCKFSSDGKPEGGLWYLQEPLYMQWKQWDCLSDCRYHCMVSREEQREKLGGKPVKYHGKWPFRHAYGFQEPVSFALSALNLAIQFHGWVSFFVLIYYKLPLTPSKKTYYEYTGLWNIYGILSMNSWFWSAVFHTLLGFSLILATLQAFSMRNEASSVMVSTPVIAFVTTHILYLNFYNLDNGLNMKVSVAMGVAQLLIWAVWAGFTHHPSRFKLKLAVLGGGLAMLLEIYDFPPYHGFVDAHALWHATTIPLTYLWWSFVKDDAEFRTSCLLKKAK